MQHLNGAVSIAADNAAGWIPVPHTYDSAPFNCILTNQNNPTQLLERGFDVFIKFSDVRVQSA